MKREPMVFWPFPNSNKLVKGPDPEGAVMTAKFFRVLGNVMRLIKDREWVVVKVYVGRRPGDPHYERFEFKHDKESSCYEGKEGEIRLCVDGADKVFGFKKTRHKFTLWVRGYE